MKRELTKREIEVLKLSGYTRKEIAKRLCLSISTVQDHFTNIRRKLKVNSKEQSLIIALRGGFIGVEDIDAAFWHPEGNYEKP
jgi:DNA-binding NarL/FixJ family response regulator